MPRGDKGKYTAKQKRQARHIEESYEEKGVPPEEAAARAWATVNAQDGGGKKSGSGRGRSKQRTAQERSESAKKAARTRARNKAAREAAS